MAENQTINTTNATGKNPDKLVVKAATRIGVHGAREAKKDRVAKRTKKQMADDKAAFLRLQEFLKMERTREGKSEVLISEFERIEVELKERIFIDALEN